MAEQTEREQHLTEREKHLQERDEFQQEQDPNRQWHRPQEHVFEAPATGPAGRDAKSIEGGTAAGFLFLDTHGEKRLDQAQIHTLIQALEASLQAVS
jgi:hypothetical protein